VTGLRATSARRRALAVVLVCLAPVVSGCLGIPDDGPVVEAQTQVDPNEELGYYNDPPPPSEGEQPADIVKGFLDAQTAIPVQTNTAKQYLTRAAASSWRPDRGTITYAAASLPEGSNRVSVELSGANRLDGGGSWRGPLPPDDRLLSFTMQREEGEWRIADLPDAQVVPETWFGQAYRRVSLYYLDPGAQIMVPEPVFLPRGDQLATALVDRLIQGPSRRLRGEVEQSFVPPDVDVELSVTVSDIGVADIRLSGGVPMPSERDAALMVSQLTWTLAQDSSLTGVRISINGEPVILSEGTPVFAMDRGRYYDPTGFQSTSELFALREGRLVHGAPGSLAQAGGPLGQRSYGLGALGVDLRGEKVAGVTTAGDRILLTDVRDPDAAVKTVVSDGTRLLPPAWDHADRMWVVDRPGDRAQLSVRDGSGQPRPVRVPGVTGQDLSHVIVSRDGSRLVAVIDRGADDRIVVSRIRYDGRGRVAGATPARVIAWEDQPRASVLDIGWSSPTSLAVLHRLSGDLTQLDPLPVDGAPAGLTGVSVTLQGPVRGVASSPRDTEPALVQTEEGLLDVVAGSEVALVGTDGLVSPTYVG
jgi:hypothetical protein